MESSISFNSDINSCSTELDRPNNETNNVSCFNRVVKTIKHHKTVINKYAIATALGATLGLLAYVVTLPFKQEVYNILDSYNMTATEKKLVNLNEHSEDVYFWCSIVSHAIIGAIVILVDSKVYKRT